MGMLNFLTRLGRLAASLFIAAIVILMLHALFLKLQNYEHSLIAVPPDYLRPPYIHLGDQKPINILHPNEFFFVHADNSRRSDCSAEARYRIISILPDTESQHTVVWYSYTDTIGFTLAGNYEGDILLQLPSWLPAGNFMLDRYAVYTCEGGIRIDQSAIGKLPFQVIMPSVDDPKPNFPTVTE
jgi:hypothetical protein